MHILNVFIKLPSRLEHAVHDFVIQHVVLLFRLLTLPPGILPRCGDDVADLPAIQFVGGQILDVVFQIGKVNALLLLVPSVCLYPVLPPVVVSPALPLARLAQCPKYVQCSRLTFSCLTCGIGFRRSQPLVAFNRRLHRRKTHRR